LMIFGGELVIFICQNQDVQDLRIYRMLLDDFWWGVEGLTLMFSILKLMITYSINIL
jgi:hypothetical protein